MTETNKLRPLTVAQWGQKVLDKHMPQRLLALLTTANIDHSEAQQSKATALVKRGTLTSMINEWPTVESDLRNAGKNGLKKAAGTDIHGMWKEAEALDWARRNNKLKATKSHAIGSDPFSRQIHQMKG